MSHLDTYILQLNISEYERTHLETTLKVIATILSYMW